MSARRGWREKHIIHPPFTLYRTLSRLFVQETRRLSVIDVRTIINSLKTWKIRTGSDTVNEYQYSRLINCTVIIFIPIPTKYAQSRIKGIRPSEITILNGYFCYEQFKGISVYQHPNISVKLLQSRYVVEAELAKRKPAHQNYFESSYPAPLISWLILFLYEYVPFYLMHLKTRLFLNDS